MFMATKTTKGKKSNERIWRKSVINMLQYNPKTLSLDIHYYTFLTPFLLAFWEIGTSFFCARYSWERERENLTNWESRLICTLNTILWSFINFDVKCEKSTFHTRTQTHTLVFCVDEVALDERIHKMIKSLIFGNIPQCRWFV